MNANLEKGVIQFLLDNDDKGGRDLYERIMAERISIDGVSLDRTLLLKWYWMLVSGRNINGKHPKIAIVKEIRSIYDTHLTETIKIVDKIEDAVLDIL